MKRILVFFAALALFFSPCEAQVSQTGAGLGAAGPVGYQGPLDFSLGGGSAVAIGAYGLRCLGKNVNQDIFTVSNGSATSTFKCTTGGVVSFHSGTAIGTTCLIVCFVANLYDQSGNTRTLLLQGGTPVSYLFGCTASGPCGVTTGATCNGGVTICAKLDGTRYWLTATFTLGAAPVSEYVFMQQPAGSGLTASSNYVPMGYTENVGGYYGYYLQLTSDASNITVTPIAQYAYASGFSANSSGSAVTYASLWKFFGGTFATGTGTTNIIAYTGGTGATPYTTNTTAITSATMQFTIGDVYTTSGQPAVAIGQFQEAIFWSTAVLSSSDMSAVCSNAVGTNGWSTTGASC